MDITHTATQCILLDHEQNPKQDATTQAEMQAEDDCWSTDGEIQKEMEELLSKKLK